MGEKPLFITFEGVDGSGKTTQAYMLNDYFKSLGRHTVLTREPGGTGISEQIREIILDNRNTEMTAMTETLLYAASRAQHVSRVIKPALDDGGVVICTRFLDSTIAYQGAARGLQRHDIECINSFAINNIMPDITFLLDTDPQTSLQRRLSDSKPDRLESERLEFFQRVREGYLQLSRIYTDRIVVIDAGIEPSLIHHMIVSKINEHIS